MLSPSHPGDTISPNDTEQFDWSKFLKIKIEGFWLTAPRGTSGDVVDMVITAVYLFYSASLTLLSCSMQHKYPPCGMAFKVGI